MEIGHPLRYNTKASRFVEPGRLLIYEKGAPIGAPLDPLAAAAVVVAAAVIVVVSAHTALVAAAAEQDQQDDDPAVVATEEAIVTHINTSKGFFAAEPLIPWYSVGGKMCSG